MAEIRIDLDADAVLAGLQRRIVPTERLMRQIGEVMRFAVELNFREQGRPNRWQALAPLTIAERQAKGYTGPILQRTGALVSSPALSVTSDTAVVTFGNKYAAIQHFGGAFQRQVTPKMRSYFWARFYESGDDRYKWMALTKKQSFTITIPARPFAVLMPDDVEDIRRVIRRFSF